LYIEHFNLSGVVKMRTGTLSIDMVNRRAAKSGIVIYNRYAGSSVPPAPMLPVDGVEQETLGNATNDLTEVKFSKAELARAAAEQRQAAALELPLVKAVLLYASAPAVNEEIMCRVVSLDTGMVAVPQNGVVVSFGSNVPASQLPKPGETISLLFKTSHFPSVPFVQAVSGTPRIVRDGVAQHECDAEGSKATRFITGKLPRTAIGTNSAGTLLYLVSTDAPSSASFNGQSGSSEGVSGMTLQELAQGMRHIGAYNAMNLDGGGSASMLVRGGVNARIGGARRIAVALGIVRQSLSEKSKTLPVKRKLISKPIPKPDEAKPPEKPVPGKSTSGDAISNMR
jgi:hypothetical protein